MARDRKIRKEKGTEDPGAGAINMTPMIDVTFQLIIFFLCLKFKTLEGKLAAYLPRHAGGGPSEEQRFDKVDLHLYSVADGRKVPVDEAARRYRVEGHKVKWQLAGATYRTADRLFNGLRRCVKLMRDSENPDQPQPLTIHAHPGVYYADVTAALDTAHKAGFTQVTFAGAWTR